MYPEFIYFLKVNIALVLFYAFYRLFFYSDTFFNLRRGMLQIFLLMAVLYPLLDISGWVKEYKPVKLAGNYRTGPLFKRHIFFYGFRGKTSPV